MRAQRIIASLVGLVLLLVEAAAGGCACRRAACGAGPALLDCQIVARRALLPEVAAVAIHSGVRAEAERAYCNLLEHDAQCLAAMNSPAAALFEQEADAVAAQRQGLFHGRGSRTTEEILLLRAAHERNRAAALALVTYLRLAEAEAGSGNLQRRIAEVNLMLTDVKRLQEAGLDSPSGQAQLEATRADLIHKLVEVEATIEELNHQLVKLLGADPPEGARLWPDVDLKVHTLLPNVYEARGIALAQRADLAALRLAVNSGDREKSEMVRAILGTSQAGVGGSGGGCAALAVMHLGASAEARQCQLETALADQERAAHQEVGYAAALVGIRLEQISLSRRRLEMLAWHLDGVRRKSQVSPAAAFDVRKNAMELMAAEQDLLHDVVEWKIAGVKLREAQGALAIECGFMAALDYVCEQAFCY